MSPTRSQVNQAQQQLVLLATGGTGGHIYPAVALARELSARGLRVAVIGQQGGMEARLVPAEGLPFYGVRAGKWHRGRPDPRQALQAVFGLSDALALTRRLRPALVVGFGGFASFPGLAAARTLGVPYGLHEQNAYPGKVTRWFARGARFVAAAQAEVEAHLPPVVHPRLLHVGMPVREARVPKAEARRQLGLPDTGLLTFVTGGSQGSLTLNERVPEAFSTLLKTHPTGLGVLHSSGPSQLEATRRRALELPGYRVDAYVESVLAWSAADLGVARGGNGTLAEAAFHGVPLIIVPLPSAAEDHQLHNARAAEAAGAGVVVAETALDTLVGAWQTLLGTQVRARMRERTLERSPKGAVARLAELVEKALHASARPRKRVAGQETL